LDNIKDGTLLNNDNYNRITVKSTDSCDDHYDNTRTGASSIRGVHGSATSEKPPLGRNKTQLPSVGQKPLQNHQKVIKVLQKHQKVYPTKNKKAKVY
jgi:hypothetical protein